VTSKIAQWTLDVSDVGLMARFWAAALGYRADLGDDGCAKLFPPDGSPERPTVWLQAGAPAKQGKLRGHLDLIAEGELAAEVERLLGLGATRAVVGQSGDEPFEVLADPEGNEFCLLHRHPGQRS